MVLTRTLLKEEIDIRAILSFALNLVPILGTFALRSAAVKSYDIEGDIAIIHVHRILKPKAHVIAETIMKTHKQVNTVPLQISPVLGKFRLHKLQWIAGENKTETVHKEFGCFQFRTSTKTFLY